MGRRTDLATLLGPGGARGSLVGAAADAMAGAMAGAAPPPRTARPAPPAHPVTVPVGALAPNPGNPRAELRDLAGLADTLRERGVLQPLGVVPRDDFLAAHPEHREAVGAAAYVVLHGHRRLAAARLAGLTELPVHVRTDASRTDEDALIENVQRDDLTELEQARALQGLIGAYGYSQREVAARIGKTQGFVSQRLALLKLSGELRDALAAGRLTVEDARRLARLPREAQTMPAPRTGGAAPRSAARSAAPSSAPDRQEPAAPATVITLDTRSTPEALADTLRRHLSPTTLDRLAALLGAG
ncbi:ParB/RepB/Spo0J family partition protein [Streptomyces polygonati]|uniref:ParB/RepB/Spo0J family partition protein n=1 Tax=Streptomyces polygonati TaxID=1617087 RepID=A0ABV8HRK0_9ACTN